MKVVDLGASLLACAALFAHSGAQQAPASPLVTHPVAIVAELTGSASVTLHGQTKTIPLELFQWLPRSAVIAMDPSSSATLVFVSGRRFRLGERAHVQLRDDDVGEMRGSAGVAPRQPDMVQTLTPLPALPLVHAIGAEAHPVPGAAAVRIRSRQITGLSPAPGTMTIAEETTLRFALDRGASRYRVTIEDAQGNAVFDEETSEPSVRVPPETLQPDRSYYWTVRAVDAVAVPARGSAAFQTLASEQTRQRAVLRAALLASADPRTLAWLAEVDRRLGLLAEARAGLRDALARAPDDAAIRAALERVRP